MTISFGKGRGRGLVTVARRRFQGKGPLTPEGYAPTETASPKSAQTRWTRLDRCPDRDRGTCGTAGPRRSAHRGRGARDSQSRLGAAARGKPAFARGASARCADRGRAREAGRGADNGAGGERRRAVLRRMLLAAAPGPATGEAVHILACAAVYDQSWGV